jgi:2'-deoxynucleoside 5'-phosphate N-hydrolase
MKIYFSGSIRGGRDDAHIYKIIIEILKNYGEVLTEHIGDINLSKLGENKSHEYIYERDMNWVRDADCVIADVSTPSVGVGYEIGQAEAMGKKILCLYREDSPKSISGMINGNLNLDVKFYKKVEQLPEIIKEFFISNKKYFE